MDPSGLIKKIEWNGNICVKFYLFLFHHLNFMSFFWHVEFVLRSNRWLSVISYKIYLAHANYVLKRNRRRVGFSFFCLAPSLLVDS